MRYITVVLAELMLQLKWPVKTLAWLAALVFTGFSCAEPILDILE